MRIESGTYFHDKYGEVRVARACTLVHFDVVETGERKAELYDIFEENVSL